MVKSILYLISFLPLIFISSFWKTGAETQIKINQNDFNENQYLVELNLENHEKLDFIKVEHEIPSDFEVEIENVEGADFKVEGNKIKIIWKNISNKTTNLSYKLTNNSANNYSEGFEIKRKLFYLKNNIKNAVSEKSVFSKKTKNNNEPKVPNPTHVTCKREVKITEKSELLIELTLKTNEKITGFAKLTDAIPEGFMAIPVSTNDAIFSFIDNQAKFLWMEMPQEKEITVAYKLLIDEGLEGDFFLTGNFTYVFEKETQKYSIDLNKITLKKGKFPEIDNMENTPLKVVRKEEKEKIINEESNKDEDSLITTTETETTLDNQENTSKQVAVTEKDSGQLVFEEPISKKENVLSPDPKKPKEKTKSLTDIKKEPTEIAESTSESANNNNEVFKEKNLEQKKVVEKSESLQANNQTTKATKPDTKVSASSNIPMPNKGISYKVQLAAGKKNLPNFEHYFSKKYNFTQKIDLELHEGWNKYLTGNFDVYENARNKREEIINKHKFENGPFVTAYNNGRRITVQEALMISNQNWVK